MAAVETDRRPGQAINHRRNKPLTALQARAAVSQIVALATKLRELRDPRPLEPYWQIGEQVLRLGLVSRSPYPPPQGRPISLQALAKRCGWQATTLYRCANFARRVDDRTLRRMLRARAKSGRNIFSWHAVSVLASVADEEARRRLIDSAIQKGTEPGEVRRQIRVAQGAPARGSTRGVRDPREGLRRSVLELKVCTARLEVLRRTIRRLEEAGHRCEQLRVRADDLQVALIAATRAAQQMLARSERRQADGGMRQRSDHGDRGRRPIRARR